MKRIFNNVNRKEEKEKEEEEKEDWTGRFLNCFLSQGSIAAMKHQDQKATLKKKKKTHLTEDLFIVSEV